ncbi:MAG: putative chromosome-partitioning protein ParB [Planctomycetota bacterium]
MAKHPVESKPGPSRLGRGLGSLIPVPAQPKGSDERAQGAGGSGVGAAGPRETLAGSSAVADPVRSPAHPADGARTVGAAPVARTEEPEVTEVADPSDRAPGIEVQYLPVAMIRPGTYQPRGAMDDQALAALAASITQSGLMQPVVVRPEGGTSGRFELIAGERRWRAVQRLGWGTIPAIVQRVGDQEAAELALVENVQREDLNPMDRAHALRRLVSDFGLSHHTLADRLGVDRSTVTNLLRLNELEPSVAALVRSGDLSLGHAKVLVGMKVAAGRETLAQQCAREEWSVRRLEQEVRDHQPHVPRGTSSPTTASGSRSAHLDDLQRRLEEHLGTRVQVRVGRRKGAGELRISFHSLDEFDGLMQRIGFNPNRMVV